MKQPLDFLPQANRRPVFIFFLLLSVLLLLLFQVLDAPLHTEAAPAGIVSFELAGSVRHAGTILASWGTLNELGSFAVYQPDIIRAAFGLGLDYLFIPVYAITCSLAVLLISGNVPGILGHIGAWVGWAPFLAGLFDAFENFSLLQILLGHIASPWPEAAAFLATIKFLLLGITITFALAAWLLPRRA